MVRCAVCRSSSKTSSPTTGECRQPPPAGTCATSFPITILSWWSATAPPVWLCSGRPTSQKWGCWASRSPNCGARPGTRGHSIELPAGRAEGPPLRWRPGSSPLPTHPTVAVRSAFQPRRADCSASNRHEAECLWVRTWVNHGWASCRNTQSPGRYAIQRFCSTWWTAPTSVPRTPPHPRNAPMPTRWARTRRGCASPSPMLLFSGRRPMPTARRPLTMRRHYSRISVTTSPKPPPPSTRKA